MTDSIDCMYPGHASGNAVHFGDRQGGSGAVKRLDHGGSGILPVSPGTGVDRSPPGRRRSQAFAAVDLSDVDTDETSANQQQGGLREPSEWYTDSLLRTRGAAFPVPASLSMSDAKSKHWDVVVIGAGPAGSMAALEISRRGASVLLVDKAGFPRPKVCGGCLNGNALRILKTVGRHRLLEEIGAVPVRQLDLYCGAALARVDLPSAMAISREVLDMALVGEAVSRGSAFLPQSHAIITLADEEAVRVKLNSGDETCEVTAPIVVVADGLGGTSLIAETDMKSQPASHSRIGAGCRLDSVPDSYLSGRIYMGCSKGGYVGLVRLRDGSMDVAAALSPQLVRTAGGLGAAAELIVSRTGLPPIPSLKHQEWRGTLSLTRHRKRIASGRIFVVGDAAAYTEPFTGEGMSWALLSGRAVAPVVVSALECWHSGLSSEWTRLHREQVGRRQSISKIISCMLRQEVLSGMVVSMLSRAPWLAQPIVGFMDSEPRGAVL